MRKIVLDADELVNVILANDPLSREWAAVLNEYRSNGFEVLFTSSAPKPIIGGPSGAGSGAEIIRILSEAGIGCDDIVFDRPTLPGDLLVDDMSVSVNELFSYAAEDIADILERGEI